MDSLFRISLYNIISNDTYHTNLIPKRLGFLVENIKKKEYPDEFYELCDDMYYEKGNIYTFKNTPFNFSCNTKNIKEDILLAYKEMSEKLYEKQMVFYCKKAMAFFLKKNKYLTKKWVIINYKDYPLFNRKNTLVEKNTCLI